MIEVSETHGKHFVGPGGDCVRCTVAHRAYMLFFGHWVTSMGMHEYDAARDMFATMRQAGAGGWALWNTARLTALLADLRVEGKEGIPPTVRMKGPVRAALRWRAGFMRAACEDDRDAARKMLDEWASLDLTTSNIAADLVGLSIADVLSQEWGGMRIGVLDLTRATDCLDHSDAVFHAAKLAACIAREDPAATLRSIPSELIGDCFTLWIRGTAQHCMSGSPVRGIVFDDGSTPEGVIDYRTVDLTSLPENEVPMAIAARTIIAMMDDDKTILEGALSARRAGPVSSMSVVAAGAAWYANHINDALRRFFT